MKANPILEEVWRIKDELAREAGYDLNRYCEQLRAWSAEHPPAGPVVHDAEELRRVLAGMERKSATESALSLNDAPPRQKP
jgi:hypothetical protein